MELSSPKLKNLLYYFQNIFSYFSGGNFQSPKNKKFLFFRKWNFLVPKLKKFLEFSSSESSSSESYKKFLCYQ